MALFAKHKEDASLWGVWKTEESVEQLLSLLPSPGKYEAELSLFAAPHRRQEWLAVRVLLYRLLGEEKTISYHSSGKPYLADRSYFISISHTRGYVAVILNSQAEVGIDIEQYGERVRKVARKYMRPDEIPLLYEGDDIWSLLLHWSAKEVMFKCMDASAVDFRQHLHVLPFEVKESGTLCAREYRTPRQTEFLIRYLLHPDFVLTWCCAS